jgi:hypothetical protein
MKWTVRYFKHQAGLWRQRSTGAERAAKEGAAAYATRKSVMWTQMANDADRKFMVINETYVPKS